MPNRIFILFFLIFAIVPVWASSIYTISENFNTGLPSIATLYGSASATGGYIQLTPITTGQVGGLSFSDLSKASLVEEWTTQFNFYAGGGTGADGLSLSFTRLGNVGAVGEWGTNSGIAIEFDTYNNAGADPNDNHISLYYDGGLLAQASNLPLNINSGQWHTARIAFSFGNIKIYLTPSGGTESLVLNYTISSWSAYSGQFNFGARTGGSTDLHAIDNFNATVTFATPEPGTILLSIIGLLIFFKIRK